jgi:hypothetical protein
MVWSASATPISRAACSDSTSERPAMLSAWSAGVIHRAVSVSAAAAHKAMGLNLTKGGLAGFFQGRVTVVGAFAVFGAKSAAVPHPDGSHRLLYSMESPESWFEDFGYGQLIAGEAKVPIDPEFVSLVETNSYHVFLTPHDDSNGLYVSRRGEKDFDVREQKGGKSNLSFSFRVIAKRKDIDGERLAKTSLPEISLPESRLTARSPDLPSKN